MASRKFATPKAAAAPVTQLPLPVPLPAPAATGRTFARPKPLPVVRLDAAANGEPLALFELGDMVRRWSCPDCPGVIREDGLALHHYECPYWAEHPDETPF